MLPLRFADYDLVHFLGRGGMGEVWSAVKRWQLGGKLSIAKALAPHSERLCADPMALNKPLALKVMHPALSEDEEYREMFLSEGSITMQLSGGNIVPVFAVGENEGLLYMTMERIDGVNLFDFQQRVLTAGGLMPLDIVIRIGHELLFALLVAHEHTVDRARSRIIHRDVKPGNVLISSVGDIRLTDFGIARRLSNSSNAYLAQGTPRYMAPEQLRGIATEASDLFAVGAILHELLTGRRFRDECRTAEDLARIPFVIPPLDRDVPPELDHLRRRLLEPDPGRRIQSAREALALFGPWAAAIHTGNTRIKTAEMYELVIGSRSSGFTRSHRAALPSFLVQRRFGIESALTVPVVHPSAPVRDDPPADVGEDDVTLTFERLPWLSDSSASSSSGPETNAPRRVRRLREVAVQHPAAASPERSARSTSLDAEAPPASPEPVAAPLSPEPAPAPRDTELQSAPSAGPRVHTLTPTEILAPPFGEPRLTPEAPPMVDRTERQAPSVWMEGGVASGQAAAPPPSKDRDRYAVAGSISQDAPEPETVGSTPTTTATQTSATSSTDRATTDRATEQKRTTNDHEPRVLARTSVRRSSPTARILTACVIGFAIFIAGIATALLVQGEARVQAENHEGRQ